MNRMSTTISQFIGVLIVCACAKPPVGSHTSGRAPVKGVYSSPQTSSTEAHHGHAPGKAAKHPFFAKLNWVRGNYLPLTLDQLTASSDLIVRGHIIDVLDGHEIDYKEGASNPHYTVLLKVKVDETVKGSDTPAIVYVEQYRAPIVATEDLAKVVPEMPGLFFLAPVHRDEKVYNYRALASIPKDGPVLQLRTPQGLIVDPSSEIDEQNAETPLEGAVVHEIDPEKETLNTIEERITAPPPAPGKK